MNRGLVLAAVALAAEVAEAWERELSPGTDDQWDPARSRAVEHASDTHLRLQDLLRDVEAGS